MRGSLRHERGEFFHCTKTALCLPDRGHLFDRGVAVESIFANVIEDEIVELQRLPRHL